MAGMITGLYAITPDTQRTETLVHKVRRALSGGAAVVQYCNKTASAALRLEQGRALLALCRGARASFIVNDDLELALALDADGVHLGADDGDLVAARQRLARHKLLGASGYDRLDLARAAVQAGADYLAFGSVFASSTKPAAVRAPLAIFTEARRSIALPLVAIGGITLHNATQVFTAGADAVAVIGALFDAGDIAECASGFTRIFQQQRIHQ